MSTSSLCRWLVSMAVLWIASAAAADGPARPCHERSGKVGYLGLGSVYEIEGSEGSIRVTRVEAGSPAERAGFAVGDTVVAIDGRSLRYADRLEFALAARARRPGDVLEHTVRRGDRVLTLKVTLGEPTSDWQEKFLEYLQHQEIDRRPEGRQRLDRLSAGRPVQVTFRRGQDCELRGEVDGQSVSLPLTLAAALRVVPVLERLHAGDSLTLEARVSGNVIRADAVSLPKYIESRDVLQAIQDTMGRDELHYQ